MKTKPLSVLLAVLFLSVPVMGESYTVITSTPGYFTNINSYAFRKPYKYTCPIHGELNDMDGSIIRFTIDGDGDEYDYFCIRCIHVFMKKNLPEVKKVEEIKP